MKKVLLLMVGVLLIANVAMADHVGLYLDGTGSSCEMPAGGYFTGTQAAVIQKFSTGTYGSRWSINFPAGTTIFSFATTFTPTGAVASDITVGTGQCLNGDIVLGYLIGNLGAGVATVVPAQGFPNILWLDCSFGEISGTGGTAYIGVPGGNCGEVATETSTWGQVKALYR